MTVYVARFFSYHVPTHLVPTHQVRMACWFNWRWTLVALSQYAAPVRRRQHMPCYFARAAVARATGVGAEEGQLNGCSGVAV